MNRRDFVKTVPGLVGLAAGVGLLKGPLERGLVGAWTLDDEVKAGVAALDEALSALGLPTYRDFGSLCGEHEHWWESAYVFTPDDLEGMRGARSEAVKALEWQARAKGVKRLRTRPPTTRLLRQYVGVASGCTTFHHGRELIFLSWWGAS